MDTLSPHCCFDKTSHKVGTCGGPRFCGYCREILDETPEQAVARLSAEDHERGLVAASVRDENGVPNPYAAATPSLNVLTTNGIPDGYATALAKENR
jgi:hypothetical protein